MNFKCFLGHDYVIKNINVVYVYFGTKENFLYYQNEIISICSRCSKIKIENINTKTNQLARILEEERSRKIYEELEIKPFGENQ